MQIVLKVHNGSNRRKLPYIIDSGSKERGCYPRNLSYTKFEEKMLEIIKNVCKIYANREMLEEAYQKASNKSIDLLSSLKKEIKVVNSKISETNRKLDQLYDDKLNGILSEKDFSRISQRYVKERNELETKYKEISDKFQALQGNQSNQEKRDLEKMNNTISEFLQMKEIDKATLFRLVDKIEIDKDKNIFITFNFAPLNSICENIDEFIEIDKVLDYYDDTKKDVG